MKGINISCSSHSSTSIYTPIPMDQASSSSSSLSPVTLLGGSAGGGGGGRAIDRHNPIIADERRIGRPTPPTSAHSTPFFTPKASPFINIYHKKTSKKPKKNTNKTKTNNDQVFAFKNQSQPSDLVAIKAPSPPDSSRYLLDEPGGLGPGFLDRVLSDLDPVKINIPFDEPKVSFSARHDESILAPNSLDGSCKKSNNSDNQVVVLRVSLHCRGCEGKVRKHISRMQGVRSFNIDFAAKKVTVEGDVTPLEVLASISKVKNAQIWTPPVSSAAVYKVIHGS